MVLSFGIENLTKDSPPPQNIKVEEMEEGDEENIQVDDEDSSHSHHHLHHHLHHQNHRRHHHHHHNHVVTQRLTNFSIAEILKPEFGVKKITQTQPYDYSFSAFSPVSLGSQARLGVHCSSSPSPSPSSSCDSAPSSPERAATSSTSPGTENRSALWPAWVYCTRYSDRPSSGPRSRKMRKKEKAMDEKRPRTAFTNDQLQRLKREFEDCRYLTEQRRTELARELNLTEAQIKIWFQNKRAKIKKSTSTKNALALSLMAQGLYNHSTVCVKGENGGTTNVDGGESS